MDSDAPDRSHVIFHVEPLIAKLQQPISETEVEDGWTAKDRQGWLQFFTELLQRLKDPQPFGEEERITHIHIARAMGHDGIDGDLIEKAAAVSNEVRGLE